MKSFLSLSVLNKFLVLFSFLSWYFKSIFTIVVDAGLPKHGFFVHHGDQYVRFRVNLPV